MTSNHRLKDYKQLPIHIEEYHHEVLEHIYRAIGSKHLPFKEVTLVHFDSHPDLGIPENLKTCDVFNKEKLLDSLSIENWLLPAVFADHINKIIWLKAEWSNQFEDGVYDFYVGKEPISGTMKVSLKNSYFLSDCMFLDEALLEDKKRLIFHVITVGRDKTPVLPCNKDETFILDVDLDFFSTRNPFKEIFSLCDLENLTKLYWYRQGENKESRKDQLSRLQKWISQIFNGNTHIEDIYKADYNFLQEIVRNYEKYLGRNLELVDLEVLHGAGCSSDIPGLPHNVSSDSQITNLINCVETLMLSIGDPKLVTIARSSVDDYCPEFQVEKIQDLTLLMLTRLYKNTCVHYHYKES